MQDRRTPIVIASRPRGTGHPVSCRRQAGGQPSRIRPSARGSLRIRLRRGIAAVGILALAGLLAYGSAGMAAPAAARQSRSAASAFPARAQDRGDASAGIARERERLEEIVVTARKRAEPLQDVPVAVSTFNAGELESARIERIDDLALMTPGFTVAPLVGGDATTPVIRGLMTTIGEPNVGFFVDGVYQSSRAVMEALIDDVERVEVLKGPQSALYGRNTFAGAVNFITRRPSDEWRVGAQGSTGSDSLVDLRARVSGPVVPGRLFFGAGITHFTRDGYFTNALTGRPLDDRNTDVYHGALRWLPGGDFAIFGRIAFEDTDNGDDPLQFLDNNARPFNPTPIPGFLPADQLFVGKVPGLRSGFAVTPGFKKRQNLLSALEISGEVGAVAVKSITGFNRLERHNAIDDDYSARPIHFDRLDERQREISQELRLSATVGNIDWSAGGFYYHLNSVRHEDSRYIGPAGPLLLAVLGPFQSLVTDTAERTTSLAAFVSLDWRIAPDLRFSAAGRYTHERKNVAALDTDPIAGISNPPFEARRSFDNFVPRFSLAYHVGEEAMVYASAARAVKTGGFNVVTATGRILPEERFYDPEHAWTYELGTKGTFLDRRLRLDADVFYVDWKNQIVRALGRTFAVLNVNAGKTTSKGVELEFTALPAEGWEVSGGLAYTDAKYDDFDFTTLLLVGFSPAETQLAGTRLQFVSKWTANGALQYRRPIGSDLEWFARADIAYQSKQNVIQTGDAFIGNATIINLHTGVDWRDFTLHFWVKNLTGERDAETAVALRNPARFFDFAAGLAGLGPIAGLEAFNILTQSRAPRVWGVTLSWRR